MKDLSLYDPEICDGDLCILDCEHCPKRHIIDGVECLRLTNKTPAIDVGTKRLYDDIDAGYTNINAISGWNGEVVYRRTAKLAADGHPILMDTNNSSNDFQTSTKIKPREYDGE